MNNIKKQIITNESMEPVGVIIDYQDWQRIEALLGDYLRQDNSQDLISFAGAVQLTVDPLEYQQRAREEWS
ncbi:MAG: hypothetical protein AAF773_20320 [Cyanobacteria bacterium P01_D01_bin.115]